MNEDVAEEYAEQYQGRLSHVTEDNPDPYDIDCNTHEWVCGTCNESIELADYLVSATSEYALLPCDECQADRLHELAD